MTALHTESHQQLDISGTGALVLTYTNSSADTKTVICRVELGDVDYPIAGDGLYTLRAYINDIEISPDSSVRVRTGVTMSSMQSRHFIVPPAAVVTVRVIGQVADTTVNTYAELWDETPIQLDSVVGTGTVFVDHNYSATDYLRYVTTDGAGVAGASVLAYLAADYDAGHRGGNYVVGRATTDVEGRWTRPMALEPARYLLVFFKQGSYGPDTAYVTVAE